MMEEEDLTGVTESECVDADSSAEDRLEFDEENHQYTVDGNPVISVTQLLEKQKISPSYAFVNSSVMKKAAGKGTEIHSQIEAYNKRGEIGFSPEVLNYVKYVEENHLTCIESEKKVYTEYYAGTLDQILRTQEGELIIADNKTTSSIHYESVSWQLSLYAYAYWVMTGTEITHGQVFWFKKDGTLSVVDIPLKSREEVEALVTADKRGELYQQPYPIEISKIAYLEGLKARQAELEAGLKEVKEKIDEYGKELIQAMKDGKVESFSSGYARFTIVHYSQAGRFDVKAFQADNPEEYNRYVSKGTPREDGLKITINTKAPVYDMKK